jgi:hypothetical protein
MNEDDAIEYDEFYLQFCLDVEEDSIKKVEEIEQERQKEGGN